MPDGNTPVLPDEQMRALGFTDHREGYWYTVRGLPLPGVTFNVTIEKATGNYEELVMDEDFGQPYHYGRYTPGRVVRPAVDKEVARLQAAGLNVEVDHSEYGCEQDVGLDPEPSDGRNGRPEPHDDFGVSGCRACAGPVRLPDLRQ